MPTTVVKTDRDVIEEYLEVNNLKSDADLYPGFSAFGYTKVIDLLKSEAIPQKKILEFYYASDEDMNMDVLSYRLV